MNTRSKNTRKLTILAMMSALSYIVVVLGRMLPPMIPITPFLTYDPKGIIIAISGFIFGPLSAFAITVVVSVIEMVTVSETGFIGLVMNIIATSAFACTASLIYKKKHTLSGALVGLILGSIAMTAIMILWNYLVTPFYMGVERQAVVELLLPAILPFNLIKSGLNTAITLIIYKPLVTSLRKAKLIDAPESQDIKVAKNKKIGIILFSLLLLATCILVILALQGKI